MSSIFQFGTRWLVFSVACIANITIVGAQERTGLPSRPDDIEFPKLEYKPPTTEGMRLVLKNGSAVWWAKDEGIGTLPGLFRLSALVRASTLQDPVDKVGLTDFAVSMMREGGTKNYLRDELNLQLDRRAATIDTEATEDFVTLTLTCLDVDKEVGLRLFDDVLRRPAFAQAEVARVQSMRIQSLKQRNLLPSDVEEREWNRLLYGSGHPFGRSPTAKTLAALTRDDLEAWHKARCVPSGVCFFGSGSLAADAASELLNGVFGDWTSEVRAEPIAVATAVTSVAPGIYLMPREQEAAHVRIGLLGYRRENEDYFPLLVMNNILGGGSFSSRITQSVRVRNGLSYVSYSGIDMQEYFEGSIFGVAQTANRTAAFAARLILDEFKRIRDEDVSDDELKAAREALIGSFPQRFASRYAIARTFAQSEYFGRPADFHETWRSRIESVSAKDVKRVARKYLNPDNLVIYMLGRVDDIKAGNPDDGERTTTLKQLHRKVFVAPLPEPENLTAADIEAQD